MGGHAFLHHSPPLPTPRMPENIYLLVLANTRSLLLPYYTHVQSPIEAPGKDTYGDVDILVTGALTPSLDPTVNRLDAAQFLAKCLSARAYISQKGSPTINLAVAYPPSPPPPLGDEISKEERYIQIDIHYLPTHAQFQWELFHAAHGDLWNMLGSTIRPFGLTVNDSGLYLRIEEIERLDRNKARVFLTSSPAAVLEFLGLHEETWWTRFESTEAMFEYAAGCRFFWVKPIEAAEAPLAAGDVEPEGGEGAKEDLKRSDRKRVTQRPIFAKWIEDFIPRCRESGNHSTPRFTREQVRLEAFEKFAVGPEYEGKLHAWNLMRHRDELWKVVIKGSIPEEGVDSHIRSAAARTFKAIVMEGEEIEGIVVPEETKVREDGFWDLDAVRKWVEGNWEEVGKVGWKLHLLKPAGTQTGKKGL